jgi:transglutaminase-like putative cysteine protease
MSASVRTRSLGRELGATIAVAAFSFTVALGFARVFSGWSFVDDMAAIVVVGHGLGLILRRLPLSPWLAVPLAALGLTWTIAALYYPETLSWGLPNSTTWELFRVELDDVRSQFQTAVAPVIYGGGWDVLAAIGLAIAVLLADVFAFRAFARAETLVPGGVLFVFVGALGDERLRVELTVALVAVGVITTAVLRAYFGSDTRPASAPPVGRVWPAIVAVTLAVALAAGFVGPRLPGADAAPLYETRGRGGGGVSEVVSPLVDIRSRLTNQSDSELFRVRADFASYWRSSALPQFDGTIWGLPERPLQSADGSLDSPQAAALELRQRITVLGLGGSLVPAAPDPFRASGPDDLRWSAETSTLVTVDDDVERGDVIDIVSASPRPSPADLAAATSANPGDSIYTDLPADLPAVVAETARGVTAGAQSTYEAARLLQGWFQREFDYSLEIQSGHGTSAIESFLRQRVGYCEQFAGTYAAMMRTLGIPARVAVGFTPGIEIEPGVFTVQGRHAHAWPEVWFDGIGWISFEPTPGRGAPGAEDYTDLPAQQDPTGTSTDESLGTEDAPPVTVDPVTGEEDPGLVIPDFSDTTNDGSSTPGTTTSSDGPGINGWWLVAAAAVAAIAAAPLLVRRSRSRARGSVDEQLGRLWRRSVGALADAGVPVAPSQTPLETAQATAKHFPVVARPVALLADAVTTATYRPEGAAGFDVVGAYGASTMRNCSNWSRQIDRAVYESASLATRAKRYFTDWG